MTRKTTITEQLQRAIRDCGMSRYELWQRTGVAQEALSRFMATGYGLSLRSIDKLAPTLGLRLVAADELKDKATKSARKTKKGG